MGTVRTLKPAERTRLLDQLRMELAQEQGVVFAYVYGSFVDSDTFHDVDVGLYLEPDQPSQATAVAVALAQRLTARVRVPVDVRVVNGAPVTFLYHVLKGRLLFCHDDERLTAILEDTARRYLDRASLLRQSTKDAFAA